MKEILNGLGVASAAEFAMIAQALGHVLLVLALAWVAWQACTRLIRLGRGRLMARSSSPDAAKRVETMMQVSRYAVAVTIIVVAGMLVLDRLGISIAPLIATAGVAGIAIGFGVQSLVKDYFTGIVLLVEDQIRKGDVIEAGGKAGLVEEITLRYVRLRDYDGNVHFIPNGTITGVSNLSREYAYTVIDAGVAYTADIDRAFGVMREVAAGMRADPAFTSRIREDLEVAGVERWESSAVVLRARMKVAPLEQWNVKREFLKRLKYAFDAAGIEIPYPHLTVYAGGAAGRALLGGEAGNTARR
jgi:small conductance mechanosensitive channel